MWIEKVWFVTEFYWCARFHRPVRWDREELWLKKGNIWSEGLTRRIVPFLASCWILFIHHLPVDRCHSTNSFAKMPVSCSSYHYTSTNIQCDELQKWISNSTLLARQNVPQSPYLCGFFFLFLLDNTNRRFTPFYTVTTISFPTNRLGC